MGISPRGCYAIHKVDDCLIYAHSIRSRCVSPSTILLPQVSVTRICLSKQSVYIAEQFRPTAPLGARSQ